MWSTMLLLIARTLGILFIFSGVNKLVGRYAFLVSLRSLTFLPRWSAAPIAAVLPWLELTIGSMLVVGFFTPYAVGAALVPQAGSLSACSARYNVRDDSSKRLTELAEPFPAKGTSAPPSLQRGSRHRGHARFRCALLLFRRSIAHPFIQENYREKYNPGFTPPLAYHHFSAFPYVHRLDACRFGTALHAGHHAHRVVPNMPCRHRGLTNRRPEDFEQNSAGLAGAVPAHLLLRCHSRR